MPDISMCLGRDCPKKTSCYRFTAFPSEYRQSYFVGVPYKGEGCDYYWKMEEHDYENRPRHRGELNEDE